MELVPALDVDGDCKEPRLLQELVATSQWCFPSTKYYYSSYHLCGVLRSCFKFLIFSDFFMPALA